MPLVNFHLTQNDITQDQIDDLIKRASMVYAQALRCPVERIRVFVNLHNNFNVGVAGESVSRNKLNAPYFDFIVLEGRSLQQRRKLAEDFTELLVEIFDVKRDLVRGSCRKVHPEDWSIGGVLASELRKDEVKKRVEGTASDA